MYNVFYNNVSCTVWTVVFSSVAITNELLELGVFDLTEE